MPNCPYSFRKKKENLDVKKSKYIWYRLKPAVPLTGENLARDNFSYMDISWLQGGYLEVCIAWNLFLINNREVKSGSKKR